jgi:hypothetical protein
VTVGSDISNGLRLDNLLSASQKYSTLSDIRIFIFIILNFHKCVNITVNIPSEVASHAEVSRSSSSHPQGRTYGWGKVVHRTTSIFKILLYLYR